MPISLNLRRCAIWTAIGHFVFVIALPGQTPPRDTTRRDTARVTALEAVRSTATRIERELWNVEN